MACQNDINSTLKISCNFQNIMHFVEYIVQLSKYGTTFRNISYNSERMYILWEHV